MNLDDVIAGAIGASSSDTFAFERVAAVLRPFDFGQIVGGATSSDGSVNSKAILNTPAGPLEPIYKTGGLLFPFNPTISEGINVSYEPMKVVHSNESYYVYQNTENVNINMADCVWVADTFQNARYVLAVIHFLRSYSMMDFGRGRTARPPSPMWLNAYGHYAFDRIPVLMMKADWTWPSNEEMDYVGIPEPGTAEWTQCKLGTSAAGSGGTGMNTSDFPGSSGKGPYTWVPVKFKVNSISLIVQHSPRYWMGFNLDDYRSGAMLKNRGGFHIDLPTPSGPLVPSAPGTVTVRPGGTTTKDDKAPPAAPGDVKIPGLGNTNEPIFAG